MNKILLSFGAALLGLTSTFAQTNAITAGNRPVNNEAGYTFEFNGTLTENCGVAGAGDTKIPNSGIPYPGISVDSVAGGKMYVSTDGTADNWGNLALRLYDGNCTDYNLDMSASASQKIQIKIKTSVAMKEFKVLLMDADGLANDSLNLTAANLAAGADTTLIFETLDFHQWASDDMIDNSSITNVLLYFRDDYQTQKAGNFEIEYIRLGDAPVGLNNGVKGESISAYPNPATSKVSFEKELENVTIYNVVGLPVYEAQSATSVDVSSFETGVYYIQHSLGTSRFTVQ